ncbi:MAG: DNA replication/repair protein RecF [Ruminococcaceae bacterium]|nr:DNA replication/repair protein RecF [Oscillospiraceae bacterium]
MKLDHIEVTDFRNISSASLSLSYGSCVLVGRNAQGKTNLMEAIYLMACGKSFRVKSLREMITHEKKTAIVTACVSGEGLPFQLRMVLDAAGGKAIYKNGVKLEKLSEFLGLFRVVLFCPEHLSLIKDGPGKRRSFIDGAICQLRPYYASLLNEFNRLESQRAALLKQRSKKAFDDSLFDVWNERLASVSVKIACIRADYIEKLKQFAPVHFQNISEGTESLEMRYVSDVYKPEKSREEMEQSYISLLRDGLESDIRYGFTAKGVHRDDLEIRINSFTARGFASQGQQRSAVLSLKLAEGEISKEMTGKDPVYLLDDVLSELDEGRRSYITRGLVGKQVILSGTDEEDFAFVDQKIFVSKGEFQG